MLDEANGNIELAQKGIILLSNINVLYKLNISGIQTILNKELPQLITSKCYDILYNGKKIKFDTTNVTIVASGNFSEISEEQMKSSLSTNKGFKYIGGFQEIIDINNISLNINDHENKKRK